MKNRVSFPLINSLSLSGSFLSSALTAGVHVIRYFASGPDSISFFCLCFRGTTLGYSLCCCREYQRYHLYPYACTLRCASLTNLAYAALMSSGVSSMSAFVTSAYTCRALHAELIIAASSATVRRSPFVQAWFQPEARRVCIPRVPF